MFSPTKITAIISFVALSLSISCKSNLSTEGGSEGIKNIESELKSKFGDNAYYTNLNFVHDNTAGDLITATATNDPASMKLEEWNYLQGAWNKTSDVTLEVEGGKPEDFMFDLNKDVSFEKIAALAETSKQRIIKEKKIEDAVVGSILINAPDNSTKSDMLIAIIIRPKNGGTDFSFMYDLKGTLKNFSY